ncbi:MAG: hypothetical protein IPM39_24165 [Chloroflexi bacterium]|nr:hypothetical protein [Chloroflexota bacterium]
MDNLIEILALTNDVLQAVIVIFGSAVVLYNFGRSTRIRVMKAFCALVSFVVIVYLSELLVSRIISTEHAANWLRVGWIGIALAPAAQFHLSDTLLEITGAPRRRYMVMLGYLSGMVFWGLVFWTDLIVGDLVIVPHAPHLSAGPLFPLFALHFWVVTVASIYNVWRARQRCITSTTRWRMTITLLAFLAAPLAVFPYLIMSSSSATPSVWFWLVAIAGNLVVGVMFASLTANLVYFGAASPDRVVRVRLFKFMARVPLAGTIVLVVFIAVSRNSPILGLPAETALGFALVATVMLVEWAIHAYKQPLERFFQLNDEPDVRRIQQLSERLLTTADLHQYLESILAATCEALRTPTTFVAALSDDGFKLEAVVGPLGEPEAQAIWQQADWVELTHAEHETGNGAKLQAVDDFFLWQNYWIRPLYNQQQDVVIGIFGIRARASQPDLNAREHLVLNRLLDQAENALQDRILQQEVFAAVEGLLPQITALQERRRAATFGGLPVLTDPEVDVDSTTSPESVVNDPDFNTMVKDALSHYWGGPKLTKSPLLGLRVVQHTLDEYGNNPTTALRAILADAIELQKPEGERNLSTTEWILYNILEMKFVQGRRVRDVARRLAMSESDLYRKQRVAIENVAQTVATMEIAVLQEAIVSPEDLPTVSPTIVTQSPTAASQPPTAVPQSPIRNLENAS